MKVDAITVITPCRNAAGLVGRTAESIMAQTAVRSGRLRLQYLVCDGASTDGTVEEVRRACGEAAEIRSEPDGGMYDALAKGMARATGQVVAYLNAGDLYCPTALDVVADVFEQNDVSWICGLQVTFNDRGQFLEAVLPYRYRAALLQAGVYGRPLLPRFVQQESTFWRRDLHDALDLQVLARHRVAGDYYLWTRFAGRARLRLVQSYLGGFSYHPGQQSEDRDGYLREVGTFTRRPRLGDRLLAAWDALAWRSEWLRRRVHHADVIQYSPEKGAWTAG
jgi:glycosyltransferase involved in cell wall biosynthesis